MGEEDKETKYLYTGQEYDFESDLYYYNARYYNPLLGRFLSKDPITHRTDGALGFNEYIYVKNNPLKYVDPDGKDPKKKQEESWLGRAVRYILGIETACAPGLGFTCPPQEDTFWTPGGPATQVGEWTDVSDIHILTTGKRLDQTPATRLDKGFAWGGLAIPVVSGGGAKKVVEILYHGTTKNRATSILKEGFKIKAEGIFTSKEWDTAVRFAKEKVAEVSAKANAIVGVKIPTKLFNELKKAGDIVERAIEVFGSGMMETVMSPKAVKILNSLKDTTGSGVEYLIKKIW